MYNTKDYFIKKTILILLLVILNACSKKTYHYWKSSKELTGTWVRLERDVEGYLIYDPCDGPTNSFTIDQNTVIFDVSQETPDTLSLESVNILTGNHDIEFLASHEFYTLQSVIKIIDTDRKLWLFKWELIPKNQLDHIRKGMMMMTRQEFKKDFRFVDNPCATEKLPEKKFLQIEFY